MSECRVSIPELIRSASARCLVVRDEDLEAIHEKLGRVAWAAASYAHLASRAESWLQREIAVPERGGQWPHWYACEDDGTRLLTVSESEHRCPKCGRVYSGEPWDSVPLTSVHNGLSQAVHHLGVYHALTGNRAAAQKAAEILLQYAGLYPHYPIRDHNLKHDTAWATKVSWGSLGESVWLIPICGGYDLIRHAGVLTPAEHQCIREQLLRPAAKLILKHNIGIHNIQCWHNAAIGSAGLLLRDRELLSFAVEGEVGVLAQISQGVRPDGFWLEGSWGYHFYGMTPLLSWMESMRNCGLDLYDAHLKGVFEAPFSAMYPGGGLPAFHDNGGPNLSATAQHYEIAYARYGDSRFAWPLARSKREDLNALLYGVPDLPKEVPEESRSTHLPQSGFVYLRQGTVPEQHYLALDYGPHGGGHGHPDKLAFVLCAGDEILAPDPGSVAYGIPIHGKWYKQSVSHNTMLVDGGSQSPCEGRLNYLVNGPGFDLVSASADKAYRGVRMLRTVLFMEGLVILLDRLSAEKTHTFDWVYHNRGHLRTGFARAPLKEGAGTRNGYEVIESPKAGEPDGTWSATWRTDGLGVRLTMLGSKRTTQVVTGMGADNSGTGLGSPGELRTPLVIARRHSRLRTTFSAVLQAYKTRPAAERISSARLDPSSRARGVVVQRGNGSFTVVHTLSGGPVTCGDVTYQGRGMFSQLACRRCDRVVLAHGTRLTWGDRTWRLKRAGSIQVERTARGFRVTNLGPQEAEIHSEGASVTLGPGSRRIV